MLWESSKFLPNRTKPTALRASLFVISLWLVKALTLKQSVNNEPQMLVPLVWRERILVVELCGRHPRFGLLAKYEFLPSESSRAAVMVFTVTICI